MKFTLKRIAKKERYTIGNLYVNGEYLCNTLEDRCRDLSIEPKVPNETAIPNGVYNIIVTHSPKFNRRLPRLLDVPFFSGILIHRGNTNKDTSGCILPGENTTKGMVTNSAKYEKHIVSLCEAAQNRGEKITIEIQ